MKIVVNNQDKIIEESQTITSLLAQMNIDPKGLAVAINTNVIPSIHWEGTFFKEKDQVTLIRATQGG